MSIKPCPTYEQGIRKHYFEFVKVVSSSVLSNTVLELPLQIEQKLEEISRDSILSNESTIDEKYERLIYFLQQKTDFFANV